MERFQYFYCRSFDLESEQVNYGFCLLTLGVGRDVDGVGLAGRLFTFWLLSVRVFEFRSPVLFELLRGVTVASGVAALAFGRFAFRGRFTLPFAFAFAFALPLAFAFAFALSFFGFFGLLTFVVAVLLFVFVSSAGRTGSGASPSLVARLMSIATV